MHPSPDFATTTVVITAISAMCISILLRKIGPYDGWLYAAFSPDGDKIVCLVSAYNQLLVIRDIPRGEEKQVQLGLDFLTGSPMFSADGTRIAFRHYYSDRTNWGTISFFSRGKLEGGYVYDWVGEPVFSHDGNSVSYWTLDGSRLSYVREHLD